MASLNKVILIGNVGSDPEMRYTPNGKAVTSFRVATSRGYTAADGERRQETEWFTVNAWNKLAETCNQFVAKGRLVYVEGSLRTHTWEGQDGQKRFRLEVTANSVVFLDRQASTVQLPNDDFIDGGADAPTIANGTDPEDLPL
ncbi:MAG TPA: single-stranded DNA-binding protein [Dehalococcoidia bacterium]|nr:single-stranded DNA-binding protein [Dehalococcoidia bacterium]